MRAPWWMLRSVPDVPEGEGEPSDGRVLIPTTRDPVTGEPDGWIWCDPRHAAQWDVRLWKR